MWIVIAVILVLAILSARARREREDTRVLRHTIEVNLSILKGELVELNEVARTAAPSADLDKAKQLLDSSNEVALFIDRVLPIARRSEMGILLEALFAAMNDTTSARHLLNACHPECMPL